MFDKLLLAVDHSEYSEKTIPVAVELATKFNGEVLVLYVQERGQITRETADLMTLEEARQLTEAIVDVLKKAGVTAHSQLRTTGTAGVAKEVLDAAEEFGANGIIIGTRGLGNLGGLLLGSVAHKVIHLAQCPVVVVR